jgi:hypothetical protein
MSEWTERDYLLSEALDCVIAALEFGDDPRLRRVKAELEAAAMDPPRIWWQPWTWRRAA